ncbi:hypothetical protein TUMEXPCC7403_24085 [Tumidithrix helvetica PCC 7403]
MEIPSKSLGSLRADKPDLSPLIPSYTSREATSHRVGGRLEFQFPFAKRGLGWGKFEMRKLLSKCN